MQVSIQEAATTGLRGMETGVSHLAALPRQHQGALIVPTRGTGATSASGAHPASLHEVDCRALGRFVEGIVVAGLFFLLSKGGGGDMNMST